MDTFEWFDANECLPHLGEEVLVWIDGHRGPAWRNNHALVAYLWHDGWREERHHSKEPLVGVIKWSPIPYPE